MKTGIVGCGMVGSASAFALVMHGVGREVVLVDKNAARARAEANDIHHAVPFAHPLEVRAGDYPDLAGADVVVLAAGVPQKPGETRLQLLQRNAEVLAEVVPRIVEQAPDCVLLVVSNPVDIMTHLACRVARRAGVPATRVIGSGTMLDTARLRALVGRHFGVDSHHVHGYVLGEHGDSEVLAWSACTIAGMSLADFARVQGVPLTDADRAAIDTRVRRAAYEIIEGKGATYYGIGSAVARLVDILLHDQRAVQTVCCLDESEGPFAGVTYSVPRLLCRQGVLTSLPQQLSSAEGAALARSVEVLRNAQRALESPGHPG